MPPFTPAPLNHDYSPGSPTNNFEATAPARGVPRFFVFLRKYWWLPVLTLLLAAGAAIGLIMFSPPVYVSTAAMWETERLHLSEGALFTEDATTYIGTQIELLKSGRMAQATMERLRAQGSNGLPLGKDGLPLKVTLAFREAPKSTVFVITASSEDASLSQNFLEALMVGYLEYKKEVRKSVSGETAASITAQVDALERELRDGQEALAVFQRTNNLAILQTEGAGAGGYLAKLQTELSDLQLESKLLKATELEQEAVGAGNNLGARNAMNLVKDLESTTGITAANSAQLTPYQELELLKIQREKLSKYRRPKHPKILALDAEIARAEKLIDLFHHQNNEQLLNSEEAVKMKIDSVQASIQEWENKVTEYSGRIAEAERLRQNVARSQSLYDRLATLLQSVDITRNTDMETLAVLEQASPAKRSYSKVAQIAALAVIAGLGLGLGLVFLVEKRDDRFTSVTDVTFALGDAVVGLLPQMTKKRKETIRLLEPDDSRHGYAESFRSLRSALLFLATDGERPKVLLITSAMPGEGKSTVAANLARILTLSGSRVLLVDGDLRRGTLHHLLKMRKEPGLAELLRRQSEAESVVQTDTLPNSAFVSCGAYSGNPGDLFLGSRLDEVLARWRREFDYVLIDSCPVFAADDASCLAPKVDGTLFVVRRGQSSAQNVTEALNVLVQRQARVLGVIFNGADVKSRNYYFYKHAGYACSAKTA